MATFDRTEAREALSTAEEQILVVLDLLESHPLDLDTGRVARPDRDCLRRHGELAFGKDLLPWDEPLERLVLAGQVRLEGDLLGLVQTARPRAARLRKQFLSEGFGSLQIRCETSPTYSELCHRVFGGDLRPFSPLDEEQLNTALVTLNLSPQKRILDLGCGVGTVTQAIHRRTGASVHGIDLAESAIDHARRGWGKDPGLSFETLDLDEPFTLPSRYDGALAIDVLYFLADPEKTLRYLLPCLRRGGQLGLFASDVVATPDQSLDASSTRLGRILRTLSIPFQAVDLSHLELEVWRRQQAAARSLRDAFEEEGNGDLASLLEKEASRCLAWAEEGRIRRFFYWATIPAETPAPSRKPFRKG